MKDPSSARLAVLVLALLFPLAFVSTSAANPAGVEAPHCYRSCPAGAPATSEIILREAYSLSANAATKFADWVAYRVTADGFGPSRPRRWRADPDLKPDHRLEPRDYDGAHAVLGMDRGHLAPLASLAGLRAWATANYLSNIAPQSSALNRGPWARLEASERHLVQRHGFTLYVVTGPLYEAGMPALPGTRRPHRVPSGYWKVITATRGGEVGMAAFILTQSVGRSVSFCRGQATVAMVEMRTGLDLPEPEAEAPPLAALMGCVDYRKTAQRPSARP